MLKTVRLYLLRHLKSYITWGVVDSLLSSVCRQACSGWLHLQVWATPEEDLHGECHSTHGQCGHLQHWPSGALLPWTRQLPAESLATHWGGHHIRWAYCFPEVLIFLSSPSCGPQTYCIVSKPPYFPYFHCKYL